MVRFLEFEYHGVNRWARSDLQDLVDLLDQFGFDCYWQGGFGWADGVMVQNSGKLWRLTGCWDDSYYTVFRDYGSNGNVACVNRDETELTDAMHHSASSIGAGWDISATLP